MKKKRITAFIAAGMMLMQTAAVLPAIPAAAVSVTLGSFAQRVRALTANDSGKAFYDTLEFDTASGTLLADGKATDQIGDLSVRGGRLMVQTGDISGRTGVQSGSAYTSFAAAAEDAGYTYTQDGDKLKITNEFQTARLIVKASGSVPHYGAVSAAEGYNELHILQYDSPASAYAAYQKYSEDAQISYVQPSRRVTLDAQTQVLSKSYNTWGADCIGVEDFAGKYLNAELLPEVVVAVIDTGINPVPALFDGRILDGGINISDSGDDTTADDYGHGTHCTGTICELTPSNVKILPVKIFDLNGSASEEQIYLGIVYSIEQGADVLNMSFGGLGVSPLEIEALDIAEKSGVICCAAAGNNADDAAYYYPGGIASAITVGAVDSNMVLGNFSNFGRMIDVVAPGVGVLSYVLGEEEEMESWNGTSMATPHAAACCALLRSYDPDMSPRRAQALLQRNAVDLGEEGFDDTYGWGLVCMRDFQWDDGICMAPECDAEPGNYGVQVTVALSCETEDAEIYYTTDGSTPTPETGTLYTEPLNITESTMILAVSAKKGSVTSTVTEAVYIIGGRDIAGAMTVRDGVLMRYRGVKKQLTVPETVDGERITAVAVDAFRANHFVERVVLPQSVTVIADGAFSGCTELRSVSAAGVTEIGAGAFAGSAALQKVSLGAELESVGEEAFSGCESLVSLDLTGIRTLPQSLCRNCASLQTVSAPDAVVFGQAAFYNCKSLDRLECEWTKVTEIGVSALAGCPKWRGALCLSALTQLGEAAFSGDSSLLQVSLPERITKLEPYVLRGCAGLKRLQLPGVTVLSEYALALGNYNADVVTELDYAALTYVGENAFYGFPIGSGYDAVTFAALVKMNSRSFAGVRAGGLSFPQITAVPESAFADSAIKYVVLESAETVAKSGLRGVSAAVVSAKLTDIAEDAYAEQFWFVTTDEIPALNDRTVPYQRCDEPLVLGLTEENADTVQHRHKALRVCACGFGGLTYQWYRVDGETLTEIAGAESAEYVPDTAEAGEAVYRCIMTDAGGKTEKVTYTVTIAAEETAPEQLMPEQRIFAEGAAEYAVTVPASGSYTFLAYGGAALLGQLTDAAGQTVGTLRDQDGESSLTASLTAGVRYTLTVSPRWDAEYALCMTQKTAAGSVSDCTVRVSAGSIAEYGSVPALHVTVTAPDGTALRQGTDYELRITRHHQACTAAVYGIGAYSGYAARTVTVLESIPAGTAIPVTLDSKYDAAVYAFVPKVSGTYYYYAAYSDGYAAEQAQYYRLGSYSFGAESIGLRTKCVVSDQPDGTGAVLGESSYSSYGGAMFGNSLTLSAGQTYYLICSGESAGGTSHYSLVVSQEQYDIRRATVTGILYDFYKAGKNAAAELTVTYRGEELTEGVDYQVVIADPDVPGTTTLLITGIGRFYGTVVRSFELVLNERKAKGQEIAIGEKIAVDCADSRITYLRFQAQAGADDTEAVRYRVLNTRTNGGQMKFSLYAYDAAQGIYTQMTPVSDQQSGDFMLCNGTYCLAVYRANADRKSAANISVVVPYDLAAVEVSIGDMPYTGAPVFPPIEVIAADGTVLEQGKDFNVLYPERHTLFGSTRVMLRATDYSYNSYTDEFEIYVDLPADAPEITVGAHEAVLTFDDRLAIYRLTADTDTEYTLSSTDTADQVLRVFTPDAELVAQDYGHQPKSVAFTVPAGETRYLMVKFNGTDRCGTMHFRLETDLRLLQSCEVTSEPVLWTGERVMPQITFRDGDYVLQEGTDYTMRYTAQDIRIGTAIANFVGMGRYFGARDVEYYIISDNLLTDEKLEPMPIALDTPYVPVADLEEEYVVAQYCAGIPDEMMLTVLRSDCALHVQRYDGEGKFIESAAMSPTGEMPFSLKKGETCYLLFSAQDVSGKNQSFRFTLSDPGCPSFQTVSDTENGAVYRVFPSLHYAELYKLNAVSDAVTLLPEVSGTAVSWLPEGLFIRIPDDTVVYGYAGCAAAEYAAKYGFAYVQLPAEETDEVHDLNGDGICSLADAVLLSHILSEHEGTVCADWQISRADCNSDGLLDLRDLRLLLRMLT